MSDIEIAQQAKMKPIIDLAREQFGIDAEHLDPYGHYKAKISLEYVNSLTDKTDGKLILVTAISPTPAGEGKTTTTVGLGDALNRIGKKTIICLREPSLGPCFGVKGGAAGGGYAQVVPMEDINLHFTGDFHAITAAHNLLAAMIDNHIYWGNDLEIDERRVVWRRDRLDDFYHADNPHARRRRLRHHRARHPRRRHDRHRAHRRLLPRQPRLHRRRARARRLAHQTRRRRKDRQLARRAEELLPRHADHLIRQPLPDRRRRIRPHLQDHSPLRRAHQDPQDLEQRPRRPRAPAAPPARFARRRRRYRRRYRRARRRRQPGLPRR